MTITVEKVPDKPLVIVRFLDPMDVRVDMPPFIEELKALFDASPEKLYDITVATDLHISFGDMIAGMAMLAKGEANVLSHPNAAHYYVVVNSDLIRIGASALTQGQYGGLPVTICKTEEEAFAQFDAAIAQQAITG